MKITNSVLIKKQNKNKDEKLTTAGLIKYFIVFFLTCMLINVILAALTGGESWKFQLFHSNGYTDLFMDFFNSMRDAGDKNVYTARNNIYPPLSLLLFKFFGAFVSTDLINLPNKNRVLLQYDQNCMIVFFVFAIICILLMAKIISYYANSITSDSNKTVISSHNILTFLMIVSYPVMYCIERGNIIILSVIMTMFFVFFKDSENKVIKELSYIALAFAAGIKLYPAIFGIILLLEKKYKDAVRLIIYGIIFVILPFIFFVDFESKTLSVSLNPIASVTNSQSAAILADNSSPIATIIKNLISFATKKKNSLNFSSVSIQNFVFIFDRNNDKLAKILCLSTEFLAVAALLFAKKSWQKIFLISYLMLNIPSASSSYSLSFLIIPFLMFLYDDKGNGYSANNRHKIDWAYIICYALLLTPLPMFWYYYQSQARDFFASMGMSYQTRFNQLIAGFVFQFMFFLILFEIFGNCSKIKKAKVKKITVKDDVNENIISESENTSETADINKNITNKTTESTIINEELQ